MLRALSPSGRIVVLIGDGRRAAGDELLRELAGKLGARVVASASQRRRQGREHLVQIERP
jgi:thiamine pyrophosphate-dependent acetolactate synthase large subunit-like protein